MIIPLNIPIPSSRWMARWHISEVRWQGGSGTMAGWQGYDGRVAGVRWQGGSGTMAGWHRSTMAGWQWYDGRVAPWYDGRVAVVRWQGGR
jgi:hypothetical protein